MPDPICFKCKHFDTDITYLGSASIGTKDRERPFGRCKRWLFGYGHDVNDIGPKEVLIEDDEGWGMIADYEFGCVLWEPAEST